jgi:hypothetical protein
MDKLPIELQPVDTCDPIKVKRGWFNDCSSPTANEVLFIVQILVIFTVVVSSIANLSFKNGDSNLWTALLSCSIGYVLPNPKVKSSINVDNKT